MAKYEPGDMVTFYFIVHDDGRNKDIRAWTDNKELAKLYLDFHMCKNFILKSSTKTIEEMAKITEENVHDEIKIHNIIVRNPDEHRKKGHETIIVSIPATEIERSMIDEECATFMLSHIRYSYLNTAIPYMKRKYQDALSSIFLNDVINKVCNERQSRITDSVRLDQLLILFRSLPDLFGK